MALNVWSERKMWRPQCLHIWSKRYNILCNGSIYSMKLSPNIICKSVATWKHIPSFDHVHFKLDGARINLASVNKTWLRVFKFNLLAKSLFKFLHLLHLRVLQTKNRTYLSTTTRGPSWYSRCQSWTTLRTENTSSSFGTFRGHSGQ